MGLLRIFGLVPAGQHASTAERLRKSETRVESLTRKIEEVHAESRAWRAKAEEAQRRVKDAEDNAARESQRLQKVNAETERQLAREKKRNVDIPALQQRLDDAERELVVCREHLMAIEVKLEILDGAANVLDARTRKVLDRRSTNRSGASV